MDNQRTGDLWTERLDAAAADARKRLQRRSPGWWRERLGSGTRADRIAALVEALAATDPTAQDRGAPPRPAADATLNDQLAVVLHDLRHAIADGHLVEVQPVLDELANALRDVDPRR